jgi:phosphoglycolate phosphatase-like HAD superfamily hydrolase
MKSDYLSGWNDTAARQKIYAFVEAVTDASNPIYVPPAERIAVFDNDGTLSCEKPVSLNIMSALSLLTRKAEQEPALRTVQPYMAAWNQDIDWFAPYMTSEKFPELLVTLLEVAAGETEAEFETRANQWLPTMIHSRFDVKYVELVYEPMVQLVRLLQANDFRVFVCSGSAMDFIRIFSESAFGIPRENVIGSNLALAWEYRADGPVIVRLASLVEPQNDRHGKPINIHQHIGRAPVMAVGNANGDIEMMEYCEARGKPFLNILLKHDDDEREYAYTHGAERIQRLAQERGWLTVSMKQDFERVFKSVPWSQEE